MPARSGTSSSSMHTATSFGSSWLGSSPSRQSPNRRSPARNALRRSATDRDSPSRQMLEDFSQMMIRSDAEFKARLDEEAAAKSKVLLAGIAQAALEHERVRESAERERQRLIREQELERSRQEEAQKQELIRLEREKAKLEAEARQREVEEAKRKEEEQRKAAEQQRLIQEAADKAKASREAKAREDAARKQQEQDAARKKVEAAAAAEKAKTQASQQSAPPTSQPSQSLPTAPSTTTITSTAKSPVSTSAGVEEIHTKFLELHDRMKEFRKPFRKMCMADQSPNPRNPNEKIEGPMRLAEKTLRSDVKKAMGQVTSSRQNSKVVIDKIRGVFKGVATVVDATGRVGGPTIDIRKFIISHPIPQGVDEQQAQYPAIIIYGFICVVKELFRQLENEASNESGALLGELSIITASLFTGDDFMWKGIPLTDLMLAKMHRFCPMLFGINGSMKTASGRERLGRRREFLSNVALYNSRMLGLAAGYAAMTLRDVAKPAIPISEFWRSLASICNVPTEGLTGGHFMVVKGLLRNTAAKVIKFYGAQGQALIYRATVTLPAKAPQDCKPDASLVAVLPSKWEQEGLGKA